MTTESTTRTERTGDPYSWRWYTTALVFVWVAVLWQVSQWQLSDAGLLAMGFGVLVGMATGVWLWLLDKRGVV